jgi:hypothetical protein
VKQPSKPHAQCSIGHVGEGDAIFRNEEVDVGYPTVLRVRHIFYDNGEHL